ncbi:hypothetical protein Fmac_009193 [Flemingia macrophylla]|uniref:Uncharacterized protein n=1 Tax=Flemingia macrophylla TaxID=520843 RepID=A0ABD1N0Q2_9FABA
MVRKARSDMKMNAIRSGIVVVGALAFGYLSLQIGFKPYLEKAQEQSHQSLSSSAFPENPSLKVTVVKAKELGRFCLDESSSSSSSLKSSNKFVKFLVKLSLEEEVARAAAK